MCRFSRAFAVRHGMPAVLLPPLGRSLIVFRRHDASPGELFFARESECHTFLREGFQPPGSSFGQAMAFMEFRSSLHTMRRSCWRAFSFSTGAVRFQVGSIFCFVQWYHPFHCRFPFLGYIITHSFRFVNSKFQIFKIFFPLPPSRGVEWRASSRRPNH